MMVLINIISFKIFKRNHFQPHIMYNIEIKKQKYNFLNIFIEIYRLN